jgi:phosphoribosyl 1,2-cyclic phosphodiesterase
MHTALLVELRQTRLMIDCGEDWRSRIGKIAPHAVLVTHAHPDHAFGLDRGAPCPVYATAKSWQLMDRFPIDPAKRCVLTPRHRRRIGGITFEPFTVVHSVRAPAVGYRVTARNVSFFYVPDVVAIPDIDEAFAGICLYVGDGATIDRNMVRRAKHGGQRIGHANVRQQLEWCAAHLVPRMIVTHCGSQIVGGDERTQVAKVRRLAAERGVDVEIARDGMKLMLR